MQSTKLRVRVTSTGLSALLGASAFLALGGCVNRPPPDNSQAVAPSAPVAAAPQPAAAAPATQPAPTTAPAVANSNTADAPAKSDDEDENLSALQQSKVAFPAKVRLGIVHWTATGAAASAGDLVFTDPKMQKEITTHLQNGGRVTDVVFIPAWTTAGLKVGKLREIAVRCNVDALLIYDDSVTVSTLGFGEPIVGSCSAEAILLDAKTGLIPATFSASGDHSSPAPPRDVDPQPERDGVAQRASLEAVTKIADSAAAQLNAMP